MIFKVVFLVNLKKILELIYILWDQLSEKKETTLKKHGTNLGRFGHDMGASLAQIQTDFKTLGAYK